MPIPGSSKRGSDVLFGDSNRFVNATSKRSKDVRECSSQPLEEYLEAVRHAKVSFRCGVEESVEIGAPTVLHRTLERLFKFNQDEKQKFLHLIQEYLVEEDNFIRLLNPFLTDRKHSLWSVHFHTNDTLLKIFISIESIQEEISEFLLEKLAELIDNPNAFATSRLLIHQFKGTLSEHSWPIIEKLLQMLDVSPRTIQSEIISSLPDIVSDQNHENVIETLKILLKENSMDSLTAVLLDALSNLNIKATQKCDILDYAKELLVTANADDLPILIKFLLMNSDKDTISGIVPNVRQSICEFMESRSKHGEDCLVLILYAVRNGLRFKDFIAEQFLRFLSKANEKFLAVDCLFCFMVLSLPSLEKKCKSLLKKKIHESLITKSELMKSLSDRTSGALLNDFSAVLAFSISLLKSREIQQTELGITIIEALFDSFQQPSKQQEILDALINTVKSSGGGSLPALRTLESLSISSPKVIAQYKQFFACLLDSIESMDEFSLKKLYIIFSILQFPEVEIPSGSEIEDQRTVGGFDLNILLTKQLSRTESVYRKMGVIGTVILTCRLAPYKDDEDLDKKIMDYCQKILHSCFHALTNDGCMLSLLYDELANSVESKLLHRSIVEWLLSDKIYGVLTLFEGAFVTTISEHSRTESYMGITCQPEFIVDEWQSNQDDDSKDVSEKEMLCMNIFPCLVSTDKSRDLISMLCSCFRLLQIGIRFSAEGSLEAIDALLGAAVISPNPRELSNFLETEKEEVQFSIFGTFFLSVSWFRELINAFITQVSLEKDHGKPTEPDEDILYRFIPRLEQLVELEQNVLQVSSLIPKSILSELLGTSFLKNDSDVQKLNGVQEGCQIRFRDLNFQAFQVLSLGVNLTEENKKTSISLNAFLFFLRNFLLECQNSMKMLVTMKKDAMDFYLGRFAPIFLHLGKKSKLLIQTLISEDRNESATSSIILEILKHIILVWRSFLQNDLCKIHPSSFRTICCSFSNVEQERLSLSEALRAAYEILERFIDVGHFFDDKCRIDILEVLELMLTSTPISEKLLLRNRLSEKAKETIPSVAGTPKHLEALLRLHIRHTEQQLQKIEELSESLFHFVANSDTREGIDQSYSLSESSLSIYYKIVFESLNELTKSFSRDRASSFVERYGSCAVVFSKLIQTASHLPNKKNILSMSLRYGKSFIDNLHRNLDYLSSLLTEYRAEVLHVFDAAGPGRRTMQIICAHGKTIKNGLIVNLVPAVQKSLEGFIYKVKAVCLKNGLKDRFNHGVLKARRIDGSVIEEDDEDEETDSAEESVNQMHSGNSDDMDGNEVPQEYSDPEL